jgi:hypothetical protein
MARNHWNPGQFKQQLDHAVASNDRRTIPTIMAQIGKANTAMYSPTREPEIAGAFGNAPAQAQPATQQAPAQTATAQPQHSISLDGKPLDPSDPTTAKIMAMLQQQGKL